MRIALENILLYVIVLIAIPTVCNGQWVRTNGPDGGIVTTVTKIGTVLFAGTWGHYVPGGTAMYRSDDTGRSWRRVETTLKVSDISVLSAFGTRLFASTDSGVFISIDSAVTWIGSDSAFIGHGAVQFGAIGDHVRATTTDHTFETNDGGRTWTNVDSTLPPHIMFGPPVSCGVSFFALTGDGVYRSTDSGASWFQASGNLPREALGSLTVMGKILFAAAGGWVGHVNLYRSTNFGASWELTSLTDAPIDRIVAAGTKLYVAQNDGGTFYSSSDSGSHWLKSNDRLGLIWKMMNSGSVLIAAAYKGTNPGGEGIYISMDDGVHWQYSSRGIVSSAVSSLLADGNNLFAGLNAGGVSLSTDEGDTWTSSSIGMVDDAVFSLAAVGSQLFAGVGYDSVFVSADSGASFLPASSGLIAPVNSYFSPVLATIGQNLYAGTYDGIFRWNGSSWSSIGKGLAPNPDITSIVRFGEYLFATSYGEAGVIRSADSGRTWVRMNDGLPNLHVGSLCVDGSGLFVATVNSGIFRSSDTGLSWSSCNVGLPDQNGGYFVHYGTNTFIATGSGIYLTTNKGDQWRPVNMGLGVDSTRLSSLQILGTNLFAGTWGDGVWRRPLSEVIPSSAVTAPASVVQDIHAAPNPISRLTTIRFSTTEAGSAEVTIVNLLGSEIARLYHGRLGEGEHSFVWDASGCAPGMYECRVQMQNGSICAALVVEPIGSRSPQSR